MHLALETHALSFHTSIICFSIGAWASADAIAGRSALDADGTRLKCQIKSVLCSPIDTPHFSFPLHWCLAGIEKLY